MSTVIVKLGGAAITDKSVPDMLSSNIDSLLDSVARVYHDVLRPAGRRLILIHGAGSFGHPPAKKYQVKAGWTHAPHGGGVDDAACGGGARFGMALTRQRVLQLHLHVLERLHSRRNNHMPVLSVSTYDTVDARDGELTDESARRLARRVQRVLDEGFVPLLSGDAVLDEALGATIVSGDTLMYHLACGGGGLLLRGAVERCVFVTDVAGVFSADPKKSKDAVLIRRIRCSESGAGGGGAISGLDGGEEGEEAVSVDDVTGAMRSKWEWARRIVTGAEQVRQVVICQASDAPAVIARQVVEGAEDEEGWNNWTTIVR